MANLPIKVEFSTSHSDVFGAMKLLRKSTPVWNALRILAILLLLVGAGLGLYNDFFRSAAQCEVWSFELARQIFLANYQDALIPGFLILLAILLATDLLSRLEIYLVMKRNPSFKEPRLWEISEEGALVSTKDAKSEIKWGYFKRWDENKTMFILIHSNRAYFPIPKRVFASQEDVETFRNLLKEKIKK